MESNGPAIESNGRAATEGVQASGDHRPGGDLGTVLLGPTAVVAHMAGAVAGENLTRSGLLTCVRGPEHQEVRAFIGLHEVLLLDAALIGGQGADDLVDKAGVAPLLLVDLDSLGPSDQVHVGTSDTGFDEFAPTRVSLGRIVDDGDCVPRREEHATPMWRGIPEAMCVCLVLVHGASREWSGSTISFANAPTSTNDYA